MSKRELNFNKLLFLDGAMGTMLHKAGLKNGDVPESFNITHPEVVEEIHRQYISAGSDIITANTFGANSFKLKHSKYSVEEVIDCAVKVARKAAGEDKLVALDIGPTGQLLEPMGEMTFEEAYNDFAGQVKAGTQAGADLILIETMSDIYEARAAILAAKENCSLPVLCTMTFQENGRTLTGTDPATMVNIIQGLGVDGLGVNCSLGPKAMLGIIKRILPYSKVPVIVQPNAGMPRLSNGMTVFDVSPKEFARYLKEIAEEGAAILGGCCGTSPEFIRAAKEAIGDMSPVKVEVKPITAVSSSRKTVIFGKDIIVVGERINPTGRKNLEEALKNDDIDYVVNEALEQKEAGAHILDVNVGLKDIDEKGVMLEVIKELQIMTDLPLQIDSMSTEVMEAAARICNGKPIINSVNGKEASLGKVLPIVKKYGTAVVALTLDERGIPATAEERVEIAEKILNAAAAKGIAKEDILVDCLALTASSNQKDIMETIKALRMVKEKFGVATCLGISNVSYGLPNRTLLNRNFLLMALSAGLDAAILNPLDEEMLDTVNAYRVLANKDGECSDYIKTYGNKSK